MLTQHAAISNQIHMYRSQRVLQIVPTSISLNQSNDIHASTETNESDRYWAAGLQLEMYTKHSWALELGSLNMLQHANNESA